MAVKICSQTETHKFEREARQMSRSGHKNIVRLFGSCFKGDCGYLVMDYEECGSLYEYLHDREQREYTMAMAIDWMIQCIQGINHMHSMKPRPLIHRDLKTANLLLSQNYKNLKIGDFGISTDLRTMMSSLAGTAGYTAPEVVLIEILHTNQYNPKFIHTQVLSGKKYTEKCDIYSFGIVLWEVMARRKPFHHLENQTAWAKIFATDRGERPKLKDIIPNCEKLQRLIENCWDQEPKNRPAGTQIELKDIPCLDIIMRP
ncbi:mitogen-activated protein kinase kinase kinase 7-like [Drosophila navojoa]|uniref:mitogen-activated protein kinase kinase kinase 7-like n=1 Tax=Drosophila navojoa TaxID=7232 RepID=UPI0011BF1A90|nr:mitogen-activated protein kinase kinase kinase 7-like [Drosophila navojoa]